MIQSFKRLAKAAGAALLTAALVIPSAQAASTATTNVWMQAGTGSDIYTPTLSDPYRYGPTIIMDPANDNNIDLLACSVGDHTVPGPGLWDYLRHGVSTDHGATWSWSIVLEPSPDSMDAFSTCDPGMVKMGSYYYVGYTSSANANGFGNHVFVARAASLGGTWEKWNGSGWGGKPKPVIFFDGSPVHYGAGEPSFVVKDGTLYFYYSWKDANMNQTRVATVSASDANWPANLVQQGAAIQKDWGEDASDVKYVDSLGKFIAFQNGGIFSANSQQKLFESTDGIHFTKTFVSNANVLQNVHNGGLSGGPDGHINTSQRNFISYAYGPTWTQWKLRMQPITLTSVGSGAFTDNFSSGAGAWTAHTGSWAIDSGSYKQSTGALAGGYITPTNQVFGEGTFEFDVKIDSAIDSGQWVGINLAKTNASDLGTSGYIVFLRANGSVAVFKPGVGQVTSDTATGTSPTTGFVHVKVVKDRGRIKVYVGNAATPQLDYRDTGTAAYSGAISLVTYNTSARFDNVSLYNNVNDSFASGSGSWTAHSGTWAVSGGTYNQTNTATDPASASYSNLISGDGTYEVDLKINSAADPGYWAGMTIGKTNAADAYYTSGYTVFLRANGNVSLYKGGTGGGVVAMDIPTGTNPTAGYVKIKLLRKGGDMQVFVGNTFYPQIFWTDQNDTVFGSGYAGLVNVKSSVSFDNYSFSTEKMPDGTSNFGTTTLPNLALFKAVTSNSSLEATDWGVSRLTDGIESTVATSGGYTSNGFGSDNVSSTPVWVEIDLGANKTFNSVKLFPRIGVYGLGGSDGGSHLSPCFPVDFTIQAAPDGGSFSTVYTKVGQGNPVEGPQTYLLPSTTARKIRIQATKLGLPAIGDATAYRMQFAEAQVFNIPNLALGKAVNASSSIEDSNMGKSRLTDGNQISVTGTLGYASGHSYTADVSGSPYWVETDLGANQWVSKVRLYPRVDIQRAGGGTAGFPVTMHIQTSTDGITYETKLEVTGQANPNGGVATYQFPFSNVRYVRIAVLTLGDPNEVEPGIYRLQLAEMEVE